MNNQNAVALVYLLTRIQDDKKVAKDYWNARDNIHATFDYHPFGHEIDLPQNEFRNEIIYLVADPGNTDSSVQGLLMMLQSVLESFHFNEKVFRLRITRVQIDPDWNDKTRFVHDLYFEIVSSNGTFIAAGCNDCTGCGGTGGHELEAIFNLVGNLLNIPVEEVVIPVGRREEIDDFFKNTYRRHYHEKHAA